MGPHFILRGSQMNFCWSYEGGTMPLPSHDKKKGAMTKTFLL